MDEVTAQRQNRKNNLEMTQVIKLSKPIPETNFLAKPHLLNLPKKHLQLTEEGINLKTKYSNAWHYEEHLSFKPLHMVTWSSGNLKG